ncbi:hypothetical protein [Kitasatospora azatica]|nr:hypothetical protein [Kitasatospora azatica]
MEAVQAVCLGESMAVLPPARLRAALPAAAPEQWAATRVTSKGIS